MGNCNIHIIYVKIKHLQTSLLVKETRIRWDLVTSYQHDENQLFLEIRSDHMTAGMRQSLALSNDSYSWNSHQQLYVAAGSFWGRRRDKIGLEEGRTNIAGEMHWNALKCHCTMRILATELVKSQLSRITKWALTCGRDTNWLLRWQGRLNTELLDKWLSN